MANIFEDTKDATEIKMNNFSSLAVESLLHFTYTSEILHEDIATENLLIAQKFKMQIMISAYEKVISGDLH